MHTAGNRACKLGFLFPIDPMHSMLLKRLLLQLLLVWFSVNTNFGQIIRDGGIDPANLGKGDWIYFMSDATNRLGGNVSSVTNEASLMKYYKSQGIRYFMVKAATSATLFNGSYATPQFTASLVNIAHTNGLLIFGYNRSYGSNIAAEINISDYIFNCGADGFVWDAEAEWETGNSWITNGPAQAWQLCSTVRSNWPNKFLAHAPFPIIYLHSTFPYKEFGYWSDAVMPQIYHFSSAGLKGSPSAAINWSDVNWRTWQNSLASLPAGNSNGLVVYWTNAIKPIIPLQDVYGPLYSTPHPNEDVMEFADYAAADPNAQTVGGYQGINFWRADLHGSVQWSHIKAATAGNFPGIVNNVVIDDARASVVGGWTSVRVFGATTTTPTYYGATGSDTNSFGTNYFSKLPGNGSAYVQFTPNIKVAGDYDLYQWHPHVTNASAVTPFVINHALGTTTNYANQQTNAGNWSLLGRYNFATGTSGYIRVTDGFADPGNVAIADGVKLVFAASNPPVNFVLTLESVGNGTISSTPTQASYAPGSLVTLTATPFAGATFSGWGGDISGSTNPVVVLLNTNKSVSATFLSTNVDLYLDNTNAEASFSSGWSVGTSSTDKYLSDYRFASSASGATATAIYRPALGLAGYYDVFVWYPQGSNRATNAPWSIYYSGGSTNVAVDQSANGGSWRLLAAALPFASGTDGYVQLSNDTGYTGKVVLADGVRFSYLGPLNSAPTISSHPLSQTVKVGSNVVFSVTASGNPPPNYQWRFNGNPIPGATAATYTRTNAQIAHSGDYSVVASNVVTALVSSNAALTVLPLAPLWLQSITALADGRLTLVVTGEPGYSFALERSTNFSAWLEITNVANPTGTSVVTDHSATNSDRGFYRARQ